MLATLAQKEAIDTKTRATKQNDKVSEASKAYAALKEKLVKGASSPAGTMALTFAANTSLDPRELEQVEQLLSEAKGLHESI